MKMKRTSIALILVSALVLLVIALPAVAEESSRSDVLPVYVNGLLDTKCVLVNGQAYTTADEMASVYGIDGSGWYDFETGDSEFSGENLLIQYHGGNQYCTVNGRYLYMPDTAFISLDGVSKVYEMPCYEAVTTAVTPLGVGPADDFISENELLSIPA